MNQDGTRQSYNTSWRLVILTECVSDITTGRYEMRLNVMNSIATMGMPDSRSREHRHESSTHWRR